MKLLLFFLLLFFYGCNSRDPLSVTIIQGGQHFSFIIADNVEAQYTYTIWRRDGITGQRIDSFSKSYDLSAKVSEKLLKQLTKQNLMQLKEDNTRGLDGYVLGIAFSDSQTSKKLHYWSPDPKRNESCKMISEIRKQLLEDFKTDSLQDAFINTLPAGTYSLGSITYVHVDHFLTNDIAKTDFYINAEQKIQAILNISNETPNYQYPLVVIDSKTSTIANLNNYTLHEIKSFEIITKEQNQRFFYGDGAENGVVIVTTGNKKQF